MNEPLDDLSTLKGGRLKPLFSDTTRKVMVGACLLSWLLAWFAVLDIKTILLSGPLGGILGLLGFLGWSKNPWLRYIALSWVVMFVLCGAAIVWFDWGPSRARAPIAAAMVVYAGCLSVLVLVLLYLHRSRKGS